MTEVIAESIQNRKKVFSILNECAGGTLQAVCGFGQQIVFTEHLCNRLMHLQCKVAQHPHSKYNEHIKQPQIATAAV